MFDSLKHLAENHKLIWDLVKILEKEEKKDSKFSDFGYKKIGCAYLIATREKNQAFDGLYVGITTNKTRRFLNHQISLRNNNNSSLKLQQYYNKFKSQLSHDQIINQKLKFITIFEFDFSHQLNFDQKIEIIDKLRHIEHNILVHLIENTNMVLYNTKLMEGSKKQRLEIVMDRYQRFLANKSIDVKSAYFWNQEQFSKEELKIRKNLLIALLAEDAKIKNHEMITDPIDLADFPIEITTSLNMSLVKSIPIVSTTRKEYMPNTSIGAIFFNIDMTRLNTEVNCYNGKEYADFWWATNEEIKSGIYDASQNFNFKAIPQKQTQFISNAVGVVSIADKKYFSSFQEAGQFANIARSSMWNRCQNPYSGWRLASFEENELSQYLSKYDGIKTSEIQTGNIGAMNSQKGVVNVTSKKYFDSVNEAAAFCNSSRFKMMRLLKDKDSDWKYATPEEIEQKKCLFSIKRQSKNEILQKQITTYNQKAVVSKEKKKYYASLTAAAKDSSVYISTVTRDCERNKKRWRYATSEEIEKQQYLP